MIDKETRLIMILLVSLFAALIVIIVLGLGIFKKIIDNQDKNSKNKYKK